MNVSQSHASANSHTFPYSVHPAPSPSRGLMESHMNVLKLVETKSGLTWHIYWGKPLGSSLPGQSGVLLSFSRCLSAGLACCYQACQFNPINGPGQNATRLVVFSFRQEHIDVASKIDPSLTSQGTWNADDGLTEEVKKYLDLALQNLIERMLHADGYVTLGTWFCRNDPTTDRQFLYRLNYFNQESSCVCAAVSVMELSVSLRALSSIELTQGSLKGRKVVLSPCGISGQLTGRSFTEETQGSLDILAEWRLVYPNMFLSPATPPLLEVLIAGVCMKYPTQFVLSYSTQGYPDTHKHNARGISHPFAAVRDLIDGVYGMDMQNGSCEYLPWNKINLDFRKSSTSSPGGERLSLRGDTPSYLTQDHKPSIITVPSPFLSRVASTEVMDLTHLSTPGSAAPPDVVFADRKKSNVPQTLNILKQESMPDDSSNSRVVSDTSSSYPKKRAKSSTKFWFKYTLPDSFISLETLYDTGESLLGYDCSGIQHPPGALGYARGMGAAGRVQAAKTKKGRTRTRSEKSSTSKAPTSRKKRLSKSEAKKQQTTPTGREDKPPDLPLVPDMLPPTSGSHSNGSVSTMPDLLPYNDVTEMRRTPVLDVLVPTPTAVNTQFCMPDPPPVFTPGPYSHGCNSSPSTDCTPQPSQGQRHPVFPGPPSAHGPLKHQMPDQIFETDDEDSIPIDSSVLHPMDPSMRYETDLGKKGLLSYSKNPNSLLLDETLSILTPPSNSQSPADSKQTIQTLDYILNKSVLELETQSFGPCHNVKTFQEKDSEQYVPSTQTSPVSNKRKLSLCRDFNQLTDNIIHSNTDDIRSRSSSRGVTDTTGPMDANSLLPGTPGNALPSLAKSLSEPHSVSIPESLRRPLSREETGLDTHTRVQYQETHALLLNLMLLDPPPISPYPAPITPFQPPVSAHTAQPNHFTFPAPGYAPPDDLLSLDALLTFGTARDHTTHTLEFYEDRLIDYFPVEYLSAYVQLTRMHHAPTGWNPIGKYQNSSRTLSLHTIQPEPLPGDLSATPPPQEHPRTLSRTLELIQKHCLSAGGPLLPPTRPLDTPTRPGGVSDLYDRQLVASTLRECCRLYAEHVEDDTLMDVTEETSSDPKEPSSPATNGTNGVSASGIEASQSETEGEASERPDSEGSQDEEDEDTPLPQLDFSLDVDNDGSWLATLRQSLDNKTSKLLRKLQASLPKLMLHSRAQSPLTWTELFRILAPVQTSEASSCSPVPVPLPALLAGQDTDWVEVAPYDVTNWDKLSLSPYSTREDISYIVLCPAGDRTENRVSNYFKQLSLVYQDSDLGRHRPIPLTNTQTDGIYTFTPPSSSLYLEADSLSALKHLLTSTILPHLAGISWPIDKQRKETDPPNPSLSSHASGLHSTSPSSDGEGHPSVVLYVLNTGAPHQQVDIMRVFSEALLDNSMSAEVSRRLTLCVVPAQAVITQRRISTQTLRALCFDVFSKCRYFPNSWVPSRGMNFVEDCDDWRGILYRDKQASLQPGTSSWMYRPPYILARPLSLRPAPMSPSKRTDLSEFNLGQKSSNTLFCGYCVSPGNSYLLAVCCDSQGSLLDSAVIGLRYPGKSDAFLGREQSLRDLWRYILSILRQTVLSWHIVITRLGRPSNEELRDLKRIVRDLESVQSELTKGCISCSCKCNTHIPSVQSVHLLSFQPEKNFRVFLNDINTPLHSMGPSSTHILVQPGPNCMDAYTQTDDFDLSENACFFPDMAVPGQPQSTEEPGEDISIFDIVGPFGPALPTPGGTADSVDNYHAVGYVLSSASAGPLPAAFWGDTRERNAFFRAQLHGQFYLEHGTEARLSYEESVRKILEQFDALSWLVLSPDTGGRVCALPLHLYTLCSLYQLVAWLITKQI